MNAEKLYERHVTQGPDSLTLEETTAALAFRDANPAEALRIQARHETASREAEDRDTLRAVWEMKGNDSREFEKHYAKLRGELQAAKLEEMDRSARDESYRLMARSF